MRITARGPPFVAIVALGFRSRDGAATLIVVSEPDASPLESLTRDQRAWVIEDERRWRRAYAIAADHPGTDAGGIYRVLRNLEKTPTERLRAGLQHGRLFRAQPR